ncbi:MAG: hypothetical protein M1839_007388 [Geoglossum umbratile]|nr:MAG: hypothetical protein M1839_007388 [Geoglossum umbratile]
MEASVNQSLTQSDLIVLRNLLQDIGQAGKSVAADTDSDKTVNRQASVDLLTGLNDETSPYFQPTVFTGWDQKDFQRLPSFLNRYFLQPYITLARRVVRRQTDVVFLTHIILYLCTSVPSAAFLFYRFSRPHAVLHLLMQGYYCGPFTLVLHNHIHNNGVLAKEYAWLDQTFPYVLGPLMGHTWNSYYYHHVKHHHAENNGPDDLSSTIRYQRDELTHFLVYLLRFIALIWVELPLYFLRKRRPVMAIKVAVSELASYAAIYILAMRNFSATLIVLILPLLLMRVGMMVGNWGQHAFVDETEPASDLRSSITLIDVASNRYCFNDGWHTAHHLNPRRHWRDHPLSFIKCKSQYQDGRALIFYNIDFLMVTIKLLQKDYDYLAKCFVPIGGQIGMSHDEVVDMLKAKTRRFTEESIQKKFRMPRQGGGSVRDSAW